MLDEAVSDTSVNETNFHRVLHSIMDPGGARYNPLQRQLLIRFSRDAARGVGRAYMDRSVAPGTYTYMLTGILADETETKPLGRITLDAGSETILPAPQNFAQVRVGRVFGKPKESGPSQDPFQTGGCLARPRPCRFES